jgi:FkbM family methyltransferase
VNFSGIPKTSFLGKLLRYPLQFMPKDFAVPILQGRFKGMKWIVGSANHGYWIGSYEFQKRLLFERTITDGSIVFDLGGFTGYYTLLASALVGPEGHVFVFEPLPRNLNYLHRHLTLNKISNVSVIEAAVSDHSGMLSFQVGPSSARGRLEQGGDLLVRTVSLDEMIKSGELPDPQYLKVDVEGTELQVLEGAAHLLQRCHPILFIDTHGEEVHAQCCRYLEKLGYQLQAIDHKPLSESREIFAVHCGGPKTDLAERISLRDNKRDY